MTTLGVVVGTVIGVFAGIMWAGSNACRVQARSHARASRLFYLHGGWRPSISRDVDHHCNPQRAMPHSGSQPGGAMDFAALQALGLQCTDLRTSRQTKKGYKMLRPFPWLLALATLLMFFSVTSAADDWETLPGGILGQRADFEGAGGIRIAGYVRRPAGHGPFPLVVLLHGGAPTAKPVQAENADELARLWAEEAKRASNVLGRAVHPPIPDFLSQGWAVYYVDFRPNPRYTLDPLEWDDTLVAINRARSWSFVDTKRIAMVGGSHGGHVTGRMVSRAPLTCAVLFAPAGLDLISLARLAERGTPIGGNQRLVREFEQRSGVKLAEVEKDPAKYGYSSLLSEVPQAKCAILMVSGKNDNNAPWPVMDAYVSALRAAGHEASAYHPENGPHGFYFGIPQKIPETSESTHQTVAFIKRHFDAAGE